MYYTCVLGIVFILFGLGVCVHLGLVWVLCVHFIWIGYCFHFVLDWVLWVHLISIGYCVFILFGLVTGCYFYLGWVMCVYIYQEWVLCLPFYPDCVLGVNVIWFVYCVFLFIRIVYWVLMLSGLCIVCSLFFQIL